MIFSSHVFTDMFNNLPKSLADTNSVLLPFSLDCISVARSETNRLCWSIFKSVDRRGLVGMGNGLTADAFMGHVHVKSRRHRKRVHEGSFDAAFN